VGPDLYYGSEFPSAVTRDLIMLQAMATIFFSHGERAFLLTASFPFAKGGIRPGGSFYRLITGKKKLARTVFLAAPKKTGKDLAASRKKREQRVFV